MYVIILFCSLSKPIFKGVSCIEINIIYWLVKTNKKNYYFMERLKNKVKPKPFIIGCLGILLRVFLEIRAEFNTFCVVFYY